MCPAALGPDAPLRRALVPPCISRLWTPPPCSGWLRSCHASHNSTPHLPTQEGSSATMCPVAISGGWIKKYLAVMVELQCSRVTKEHPHVLRHLQDMWAGGVIMTYKTFRHATTMPCYNAVPRGWPLAGAASRSYDSIGDCTPCGRTNKTKDAWCRRHYQYITSAFNALDTAQDLHYSGATCRALGHSVTTWPWAIKGRVDGRSNQDILGKFNSWLEHHIAIQQHSLRGRRVLRFGGPNLVNHCVHRAFSIAKTWET
jgi:hypothetical protein